ncbi:MAG: sigma 54-interacting transcriptional regulator, partial [Planctomycetes bacterium]|nr:sigma 54-interacting transcriptional regulator [Planctomycetota bacterium]
MPREPKDFGPRYEYLGEIGRGGMGRVVLVRDKHLDKQLALKLLLAPPEHEGALERFQEEFALLCQVKHPGIARAHDFGYLGRRPFFTCEFIAGLTLARSARTIEPSRLVTLAQEVAEPLAFLHRSRILHLDVKPSNIVLREPGGRPVLVDFGIFRRGFAGPAGPRVKGSLPYMAPECFQGGALGPWTDVYALGATLYQAATGRLPREVLGGRLESWVPVPVPPDALRSSLPSGFGQVVLRCLALGPRARFQDAGEVLAALEAMAARPRRVAGTTASAASGATIGRDAELARAERWLHELRSGEGAAVLAVTGPPGVGSSHLLREIKLRAQIRGFQVDLEERQVPRPGPPGALFRSLGKTLEGEACRRWEAFLQRLRKPRVSPGGEAPDDERRWRWAIEMARAAEAVRGPFILMADGLERFDEVSATLFCALARHFTGLAGAARRPIGLVAAYREEGPSAALLGELSEHLLATRSGSVISLKPLSPAEARELFRARGGKEGDSTRGFGVFQATGGLPARVVALAEAGGELRTAEAEGERRTRGAGRPRWTVDERRVLEVLRLLERPATAVELSRFAGLPPPRVRRGLRSLASAGFATARGDSAAGGEAWKAGPRAAGVAPPSGARRRRALLRIGRAILRESSGCEDPWLVEAVRCFRAARSAALIARHGLPLARHLKATFQSRAALGLYRDILAAIPRRWRAARWECTLEIAELQARAGEIGEGIQILVEALSSVPRPREPWRTRLILRQAALHSRRGDFRRAEALFREGLDGRRGATNELDRAERLYFLNEHAATKAFSNDPAGALRLCEEGLRLAGRGRGRRVREAVLNLRATQGNVALRAFRFGDAAASYATAIEIADAIGSLGSKAVVLNNLGIVHAHRDRYGEAIEAFREAERICLRIDEGPSLAFIQGNLAVLCAKVGDPRGSDAALEAAQRLGQGQRNRRQDLFVEHSAGLALLYRGRFAEARLRLEAALRLGESVGDRLVASFDGVYRGECLVFEGLYGEAARALERAAARGEPTTTRRMALARRMFLEAFLGQPRRARETAAQHGEGAGDAETPFLAAWDKLYLGWGWSLIGEIASALEVLPAAERFFRSHGLGPAAALAAWVQAEARFLSGHPGEAREALLGQARPTLGLAAGLWPLLEARLGIEDRPSAPACAAAADLLAEAGAALVGAGTLEWELRVEALRASLVQGGESRRRLAELERKRRALSRELPPPVRASHSRSPHWRAWTGSLGTAARGAPEGRGRSRSASRGEARTRTAGLRAEAGDGPGGARAGLVAASPAMRALLETLDRLRGAQVPVLIRGETGAGKEMVARIIHAESRRAGGPLVVIDCATLPAALLEAELVGARAGAFTDLRADREGLIPSASGGTALIDEVASLSLEAQAKLLRVLSEGRVRPVGAAEPVPADVR